MATEKQARYVVTLLGERGFNPDTLDSDYREFRVPSELWGRSVKSWVLGLDHWDISELINLLRDKPQASLKVKAVKWKRKEISPKGNRRQEMSQETYRFIVHWALCDYADDHGQSSRTMGEMSKDTGLTPETIWRTLRALEKSGDIKMEQRPGDTYRYTVLRQWYEEEE